MKEILDYIRSEWQGLNRLEKVSGSIIVTVLFVLFTSQWLYSAAISGTNIAAKIAPFDTADTYPTHDARYGKGGLVQVGLSTLRRNIPLQRRYTGMMLYSAQTDKWYYLKNGTANTNWTQLQTAGYDGKTIPDLYCNLSGGSRSHNYDGSPAPAPFAFKVRMWINGVRSLLIKHFKWSTPPRSLVYGTSTSSSFTPSLHGSYSANRNNAVEVMIAYSTVAGYGGKRWCSAGTPIAVTRKGDTGQGLVTGGTVGQMLRKKSSTDFDTEWYTLASTLAWGNLVGTLSDQTDLWNALIGKEPANSNIQAHIGSTNNPHSTTANQVLPAQVNNGGKVLGTDGSNTSWVTGGGGGSPDGSNRQLQYNNNGSFGGAAFARYSVWASGTGGTLIITGGMVVK